MVYLFGRMLSIVVMISVVLHLFWAFLLFFDPVAAVGATGLNSIYRFIPDFRLVPLVLILSSVCATIGILYRSPWIVFLLIPQQILLMMTAAGASEAIWLGQFADGVLRSHVFIAADQIGSILLAVGHTIAIIAHARRVSR